jgi:hypothetical protein
LSTNSGDKEEGILVRRAKEVKKEKLEYRSEERHRPELIPPSAALTARQSSARIFCHLAARVFTRSLLAFPTPAYES